MQDGLLACWDGIENAGAGIHNPSATKWIDLIAGREFNLYNVTVADDRMVFLGEQTSYGELGAADTAATFENAANGTLEIVYASDMETSSQISGKISQIMLQSSEASGHAMSIYEGNKIVPSNGSHKAPYFTFTSGVATNSVSVRYASAKPTGARTGGNSLTGQGGDNYYWGGPESKTTIGTRTSKANNPFKGGIYCIRVYSRQLTDAEIDANHAVDVIRFREGNHFDDLLVVTANPENCGSPSPSGSTVDLVADATVSVSCGETPWTNATETAAYVCKGWKLYDSDGNMKSSGVGTSFTYTHPNPAAYRRLEWQWALSEVKGTVTAGANGTVSPSGTAWFSATPATVTATPSDGFAFSHWEGNLPSGINANDASVTFTPTAPFDMTAVFASAYYVATNGNDSNPGTKAQPFATIAAAVTAVGGNAAMILVADGTYTLSGEISVTAPITIAGESGNRDAVIVIASANSRAFTLSNAFATLSGITVLGGGGNVTQAGGNIYIGTNGGIVRNCVVANGRGYYGGNIAMGKQGGGVVVPPASALIVDCVISNGTDTAAADSWDSAGNIFSNGGRIQRCVIADGFVQNGNGGGNVRLNKAGTTIENCLITGGSGGNASASLASGIAVNQNGRVVNCTIVGNTPFGTHKMAVRLFNEATEAKVVNCVIYGNGDGGQNVQSGDFLSCFVNCAFSSDGENCADTVSPVTNLTDADFKKYAIGDYRPKSGGALFNAGNTELYSSYATSATDLDGAARIGKKGIDIGCYKAAPSTGLQIYVR